MILGTAGHIDHGKTALVRALTGVDTDRLPEERRRGITIELGFAPLRLPDGSLLGVVDVPGHEAFVRTMLAGASGIDLALLVVAADEGVMPQTREHLSILSLLGVRAGIVALSKCDLADAEWLSLVEDDVRVAVDGTPLHDAPILRTSATTGEGIAELLAAIGQSAATRLPRPANDLFRMPVDRAFTLRGTGTVVTGTIWGGSVSRDALVRLLPGPTTARVRGIHVHGADVSSAEAGTRAALALAGVDLADVGRGMTVVSDPAWETTRLLRATVSLLPDAPRELRATTRVRLHLGTAEVGARVVSEGGAVGPGDRRHARIVLDRHIAACAGDRFVMRVGSPVPTIGGGIVLDPLPPGPRARPLGVGVDSSAAERLRALVGESGYEGVRRATLPLRLGVGGPAVEVLTRGAEGSIVSTGDRLFAAGVLERLAGEIARDVDRHHADHPLDPGAPLQTVRASRRAAPELVEVTIESLVVGGTLETVGGLIRRVGWSPHLEDGERSALAAIAVELHEAGREPPTVEELARRHGPSTPALLRLLERDDRVVLVEQARYFDRSVLDGVVALLRERMQPGREHSPAELRDLLGVTRKYLIPILEYCDRQRVTERRSSGRALAGT